MTRRHVLIFLLLSTIPLAICFLASVQHHALHYRDDAELNQQLWSRK